MQLKKCCTKKKYIYKFFIVSAAHWTLSILNYLINFILSSAVRNPHSLIAASRIAVAAWNLAFGTCELSEYVEI